MLQRKTTLHLALQYLIIVLSKADFPKPRLGLVAATCLLLASKYDELDNNVPLFEDVLSTVQESKHLKQFDRKFTHSDLEECEAFILKLLDWNLMQLTPFQALSELLALGVTFKNDRRQVLYDDAQLSSSRRRSKAPKVRTENVTLDDARSFRELAIYFADLSSLVYRTQEFKPTVVASACVLAARKKFKMQPLWNEALRDLTQHCYEELVDCMNLLLLNYKTIDLGKRTASTEDVLGVAPFSERANRSSQSNYEPGP